MLCAVENIKSWHRCSLNIFYVINSSDPVYNVHARPGFVLETVSINRAEGINVDMRDM